MGIEINNRIKQFWVEVKQDSEALFELRQLLFGVIIAVAISYGFYTLYAGTKEKENKKYNEEKSQLTASSGGKQLEILLSGQMRKLAESSRKIEARLALLEFKEKILREQYSLENHNESFAKAIFTLLPLSPVDIENGFVQMNVMESRSFDFFDINPVNLQGDIVFSEFLYYLQYLEKRPEVGMIGDISLELLTGDQFAENKKIHFDVVLGTIQLR